MDDIIIIFAIAMFALVAFAIIIDKKRASNDDKKVRKVIAADIPMAKAAKEKERTMPAGKTTNKIWMKTEQDFMGIAGSRPFMMFDENWNQMPLDRTVTTIPREHLTRMYPLAYLAGKVSVFNNKQQTSLFMVIILLAALGSCGIAYMMGNNTQQGLESANGRLDELGNQVGNLTSQQSTDHGIIQAIAVKLDIPIYGNNSIQTVG